MPISDTLAHRVLERIAEATGALEIAERSDDKEKTRRIVQAESAMRKAAQLISDNTYKPEA